MQATPPGINLKEIKTDLETFQEIANIHHVHIWNMNETEIHFECHIELMNDIPLSETREITRRINSHLLQKYRIHHTTVQYEYKNCDDQKMISH